MAVHDCGMSGRFILALAGIALLIPFFFLPRRIVATAYLVAGGVSLLSGRPVGSRGG
jgi:hypothetical protein